jgi:hypothetical protein
MVLAAGGRALDLTVGTPDEDIVCLNFATFRYLIRRAAGDLSALCVSAFELRNIWCISQRLPIDLGIEVPTKIEMQTFDLDAPSDIARLKLSDLSQAEVSSLPALPDEWRGAADADTLTSYLGDSLERLSPAAAGPKAER